MFAKYWTEASGVGGAVGAPLFEHPPVLRYGWARCRKPTLYPFITVTINNNRKNRNQPLTRLQDICHLILILNAAENSGTIISLLEPHTLRHYAYLRDTMPQFVPVLSLSETTGNAISRQMSVDESLAYLNNVISNLDVAETMTRSVYTFTKATEYFFRPVSSAIKCYRLINSPRRHTFFFFQFIFFTFCFLKI